MFIGPRPPPPPMTQYPPPPYKLYTCILYTYSIHTGKGGGGELNQREVRGATVHSWVEKNTNMTDFIYKL
jgi:hypothetical protein